MTVPDPFRPHLERRQSGPSLDIRTDTKSFFTGGLKNEDANIRTLFQQIQTSFERGQHFRIESIQLLWSMQRNPRDRHLRRDLNFG